MLLRVMKLELKRALFNCNFFLALLLGMFFILSGIYFFVDLGFSDNTPYNAWMNIIGSNAGLYLLFFGLMASLSYASSYSIERNNRMTNYFLIRVSRIKYLTSKGFAVFVSGFFVILLHCLLLFLISYLFFGHNDVEYIHRDWRTDVLSHLLPTQPLLYITIYSLWIALQGAFYALLGFSASLWVSKPFFAVFIPFIYFHLMNFIPSALGFSAWYTTPASITPFWFRETPWSAMFFHPMLIVIISIFMISYSIIKERVMS